MLATIETGSRSGDACLVHRDGRRCPVSMVLKARKAPPGAVDGCAVVAHVVAAGVATEAQPARLRRQGSDQAQGYPFRPPTRPVRFDKTLKDLLSFKIVTMTNEPYQRTLLLVDDEANVINSLKRTLRHEGYQIITAPSGREGLDLLARYPVGVILSDQRMPEMTGVEFLRKVKTLHPKTVRIVLSGYTELDSVTQAINEGAIYKFLTKPWEDDLLREHIREAFRSFELERDNRRLNEDLRRANEDLADINRNLERQVEEKTREIVSNIRMLQVSQDIVEHLPIAVFGVDDQGMIALSNRRADEMFCGGDGVGLMGEMADQRLPGALLVAMGVSSGAQRDAADGGTVVLRDGRVFHVLLQPMGEFSRSSGTLVVLYPQR